MRAKFSASNDCLQLPQVAGGNLSATADNLREASFARAMAEMFKSRDVFFYPVPNNLTDLITFCR